MSPRVVDGGFMLKDRQTRRCGLAVDHGVGFFTLGNDS
jgi:hypothetical protein